MPKKNIELSKQVKGSKKTKKSKRRFTKLLSLIMVLATVVMIVQIIRLNLLPTNLLIVVCALLAILVSIILILTFHKSKRGISRFFMGLITLCMAIVLVFGNYFVFKAQGTYDVVTNIATKKATTTTIVTLKENSSIKKEKNLNNVTLGVISSSDKNATQKMLDKLKKDGIDVTTKNFDTVFDMADALYNHEVDAICLNEKYRGDLHDTDQFFMFNTVTKNVCQNVYYTEKKENDNPSDPVNNVSKDAFTILVSGNDSYGTLSDDNSRSDSNMLLTVNPKTHTILMTSIPRDYYVKLMCPESGDNACPEGSYDKLTHSGLLGIKSTEKSIENALGIKINYNIRINFSSVVNLVDALDGIDLNITDQDACDVFYANGQPGLDVGTHHVDGETALAFARERHAYVDGDNQRVRNQQKVFKAMIKRMVSSSMIKNYGKFMDALAIAFDTNISSKEISDFVKYELAMMPKWKFESYSLSGESGTEFCYEVQDYASIVYQNGGKNKVAKEKIEAVLNGKSADSIVDVDGYTKYPEDEKDNTKTNNSSSSSSTTTQPQQPATDTTPSYTPDYSQDYNQTYTPDTSYDASQDDSQSTYVPSTDDANTYDPSQGYEDSNY